MSPHRHLVLLVVVLLGVGLASSTGGFSSAGVDRGISVQVSDDDSAYVAFEQTTEDTETGTTDLELTVTNRLPSGAALTTLEVTVNESTVDLAANDSVWPNETVTHSFSSVECGDPITVAASGNGVSVRLDRTIQC
ncbi:hypothetical protein [Halobacterium bonnevillei]|uniref:Uncharacterized protein n=1 Tax=Halobacterium bonnevillei TaxID=2692200 RepID=A0A6B0SIP5_9EURY|nr:hypothetical protein [Halobacterium bonnevillei]MXR21007.1 hypothetical protein [Halobacterium bonnevillei]